MIKDPLDATTPEVARLTAEVDALRAERDRLQAGARRPAGTVRRLLVGVLVVVAVVAGLGAGIGLFSRRNLLDTDRWVSRVGPLAEDPAVEAALSARVTQEVMRLVDVDALLSGSDSSGN